MPIERKLAAIMFTDIAGYTAQMSKDQDVAFSLLETKQKALRPLVKKHNGTLINQMGDGTLSHFPTAVDASNCSIEFQKSIRDHDNLNVRIGVHLGDTMFKDNDVFGDGVNIASRLESMSPAGGVLVSKNIYDELTTRQGFNGVSLGLQSLKGIGRLVEVFALKDEHLTVPNPEDYKNTAVQVHKDNEIPSIAIIPFDNKGDDENEFYAYSISADLISDVTSAGLIRVASKKDIEKLNYQKLNNVELSQKLLVRYISTGELWRLGDLFQLSVELYDTKESKVIWSDRWQESWDNLPAIKGNLSDGLLTALDTMGQVEKRVDTTNSEAYEYYLRAKHKYEKRVNTDDMEIARGLLKKANELDDNLILAKTLLGWTYYQIGNYDKAMEIYRHALKQADNHGDKRGMGMSLNNIGNVYNNKGSYDKALDCFTRSLEIREEINDKIGIGISLNNIGLVNKKIGNYDKALDYYTRSLDILAELGDKRRMGSLIGNIGNIYKNKGDYDKALDYHTRSLEVFEELGDKNGIGYSLNNIGNIYKLKNDYDRAIEYCTNSLEILERLGDKHNIRRSLNSIGSAYLYIGDNDKAIDCGIRSLKIAEELGDKSGMKYTLIYIGLVYYNKGDYDKVKEYLEKSVTLLKESSDTDGHNLLTSTTYLFLSYKKLGIANDEKEIHTLIKETEHIEFELNFRIYQLMEDIVYLETAYNQVQDKADNLEPDMQAKFLSYPAPKAIVEEWEKVK